MSESIKAYSYIRFSSERQKLGDSLRRQLALAEHYAALHNLTLDSVSYRDMGISAFKGKNAVEGKLAMFLQAVDRGLIAAKAFLLVESLDRLSRHEVDDALELFLSIIRRGLTIVTLTDAQTYNTASIKRDRGISLIVRITIMMRAHDESAMKSWRAKEVWRAKAERGEPLSTRGPSWVRLVDGKWKVDRKGAAAIQRIFKMCLDGHGCHTIARVLNDEGVPTRSASEFWTAGALSHILRSPLVLGMQGQKRAVPIENVYPPIVSREDFDRVRLLAQSRARNSQPASRSTQTIFIGTARCSHCGTRMRMIGSSGGTYYLICARAASNGGCPGCRFRAATAENALLTDLLDPRQLLPDSSDRVVRAKAAYEAMQIAQAALRAKRDKLVAHALRANDLSEFRGAIESIDEALIAGQAALADTSHRTQSHGCQDLKEARRLSIQLLSAQTPSVDKPELRVALRPLLFRLCNSIVFDSLSREMQVTYASGLQSTLHIRPLARWNTRTKWVSAAPGLGIVERTDE